MFLTEPDLEGFGSSREQFGYAFGSETMQAVAPPINNFTLTFTNHHKAPPPKREREATNSPEVLNAKLLPMTLTMIKRESF